MSSELPPVVREDVEPILSSSGRWECPWPGCPSSKVPGAKRLAAEHAKEPHVRCTCGRYFRPTSIRKHLAQTKRYGIDHPPFYGERDHVE